MPLTRLPSGIVVHELDERGGLIGKVLRARRRQEEARTGLHVSTIVNDWLTCLDPKRYGKEIAHVHRDSYWEIGNALEDVLAESLRQRISGWKKPIPQIYRGVEGSPDGWRPMSRSIDEIKATWVSERDFLTSLKFLGYLRQAMMYAEMWGALRISLHILFINGNWRPPMPKPRTLRLSFTPRVRFDSFEAMVQHAIDRRLPGWRGLSPRVWSTRHGQ